MQLKRDLKLIDVFAIATGAMISSGIFILPGIAFSEAGPAVFMSYFLAGILALTGALSMAEMVTAMPKAGGDYFFITRSLGGMTGTVSGILSWMALSMKSAFAILGIAEIVYIFLGYNVIITSLVVCLLFMLINLSGVKEAGRFQVILVAFLVSLMAFFILTGFFEMDLSRFKPMFSKGINSMLLAAGLVFVSYGGLLKVASVAEEVDNPKRNLPFGILLSIISVIILYSFALIVVVGVLDKATLATSLTPIADAAQVFSGKIGYFLIMGASVLAFFTTANAGILAASRYPLALSRDSLIPSFMNKINRQGTPFIAIILTSIFVFLSLLLNLEILVKVASTVVILNYILSNVSVIILRESRMPNYKPSFKAPLYPWLQLLGIIAFSLLLIDMGMTVLLLSVSAIFIGIIIYFTYGRRYFMQEAAISKIVKRVLNNNLKYTDLDHELKHIIIERENITKDFFDVLMEGADIIDTEVEDLHEFFHQAAELISAKSKYDVELIENLLNKRETDCCTAITDFTAIPHIILPGEGRFNILVMRSKKGIEFIENHNVKAIFIIYGTLDLREYHLKSLAAIAQIIQSNSFEKKWEEAENTQELRDILVLSKRHRHNPRNPR